MIEEKKSGELTPRRSTEAAGQDILHLPEPSLTFDQMKGASTFDSLLIAGLMLAHKVRPFGYERVAVLFRDDPDHRTAAHYAWLLAEASLAGKQEEMTVEFPDAVRQAEYVWKLTKQDDPHIMHALNFHLNKPE